jgi:CheY-like chemotaxis protein/transcriptional regulator with XRE-family HTH domain
MEKPPGTQFPNAISAGDLPLPSTSPDPGSNPVGRFRATELEQHIGKRLRFIRRLSGLSLQDLADEIGLSAQQVGKYESGRNRISAVLLVELSGLFSLPMDWFIGPFDPRRQSDADDSNNLDYQFALDQFFRAFQDRDESEAVAALDFISQVAGLGVKNQQTPLTRIRTALRSGDASAREALLSMIKQFTESQINLANHTGSTVPREESKNETEGMHRVLLVDDDPIVLSTVATSLMKAGFFVKTVMSGIEALTTLEQPDSFDVMVTDNNMANMDGVDLVSQASQLCPNMPAIIITGFADSERLRDLRPKVEILTKPFRRMELIGRIRLLIERASGQQKSSVSKSDHTRLPS